MDQKNLQIADYTYDLPADRIAAHPLPDRDASRLLIYSNGNISEDVYRNIASHLPPNSLVVFNDTKVIEARILFQKSTGAFIEVFCLEPDERYKDVTTAMMQEGKVYWKCMIGGASKWKHGLQLHKEINNIILSATITDRKPDSFVVEFAWTPANLSFAAVLHEAGLIPLPPYIKRNTEPSDAERYQTVYAHESGSVAAPTAGLHFTERILAQLPEKAYVTLHVGAGTFKPVKTATIGGHSMHAEFIQVTANTIKQLLQFRNITAVGTTSLRTIESLYWMGVKATLQSNDLDIHQWDAYELPQDVPVEAALNALLKRIDSTLIGKTQLLIVPGYKLRVATSLVTNFHQPQSTLLLLVAAVAGPNWRSIYDYALQNGFRFLSYGDGCLIIPAP